MINPFHKEILALIKKKSGNPKADPFLSSYLGNDHIIYPINNPALRDIAKEWMRAHRDLKPGELTEVLTSLIEGESCTEKMMAGILLGYSARGQRSFDPMIFDRWLDHLAGWVEVDTLCTGDFLTTQVPSDWLMWKKLIRKLSNAPNINKRRASLVLFCSVLGRVDNDDMADLALRNIERLKSEKDVRITKAISWVLRTMIRNYRSRVTAYLKENQDTLPRIAVRETLVKLKTGRKGG